MDATGKSREKLKVETRKFFSAIPLFVFFYLLSCFCRTLAGFAQLVGSKAVLGSFSTLMRRKKGWQSSFIDLFRSFSIS